MNFPDNVDYGTFYRQAKSKGIKISSKYAGVFVTNSRGRVYFTTSVGGSKERVNLGCFPLTKQGELKAHRTYIEYKSTMPSKSGRVSSKLVDTAC